MLQRTNVEINQVMLCIQKCLLTVPKL